MTTPDAAVRTVATATPMWARPGDTLRTLAETMHAAGCGALIVMGRGGQLAVVSERDVVRALAQGTDADDVWATDVMTRTVLTTSPDEPILSVAGLMADAHVRHVVLVDEAGAPVGIASIRDVLRPLLDEATAARHAGGVS
jgi:CBS domain-containing protein